MAMVGTTLGMIGLAVGAAGHHQTASAMFLGYAMLFILSLLVGVLRRVP